VVDYSDHAEVLKTLSDDWEAENDLRETVGEVIAFMNHPQGQWEPEIRSAYEGRPRYTFDQTNPQVNKAWSEMAANEYAAETQPVGAGSSEKVSKIIDGLVRKTYNISSFDDISTRAGKRMIATGFGGWRIISTYIGESFFQELKIVPINNIHERIVFDRHSEMQTREDGNHVIELSVVSELAAKEKWKKRDAFMSLSVGTGSSTYSVKKTDFYLIGEISYKNPITKTVYLIDDESQSVVDEDGLKKMGLSPDHPLVVGNRECDTFEIYSRKFDGMGWLEKEKLTVFKHLPIIPEYANFDVVENKITYRGVVQPIMDSCRVFNYVESRKVEEAVLSPRRKIMIDDRTVQGRENEFSALHISPNAVQLYRGSDVNGNPLPPPMEVGGINPSPGLSELSGDMIRNIELTSGLPNELTVLQNTAKDSDFRFGQRSSMGQLGTFEYYRAHKIALEHTAKVLLGAIPKVYDTKRMVQVIGEDGQSSQVLINNKTAAQELQNDLTVGMYDICVSVGPAFKDRQADANSKIVELSQVIPGLADRNADVLAYNSDAPGMATIGDRERERLFNAGAIPIDQLTDKEKERLAQKMQQPQPPDPMAMVAQAELKKAQVMEQREQIRLEIERIKLQMAGQKQMTEDEKDGIDLRLRAQQQRMDQEAQAIDNLNKIIDGLKTYKEIVGAQSIVTPQIIHGLQNQSALTTQAQNRI
jgi:hypothetical protein